ncbi:TspO/MBR family protein [Kocuria arenosa]|uniref:TspO/MBR family protein n=1 Tax=Kocuria arenosa TaxID=3071446 RepID=UPI0034D494F5
MTTTTTLRAATPAPARRYRWWHAVAVGLTANAASVLPAGFNGDPSFYNDLDTPPGAPPDWLFPPVWAFNNATALWSNLRIANLPPGTPSRTTVLVLEGVDWALFASFSALYFGLRSPVLGATVTVASLGVTAASVVATAGLDRRAAWALSPRLLWLAYASYIATVTAAHNRDKFLGWEPRPA